MPLFIQGIIDGAKEEGIRGGLLGSTEFFGMSTLTYHSPDEDLVRAYYFKYGKPFVGSSDQWRVANNDSDLKPYVEAINQQRLFHGSEAAVAKEEENQRMAQLEVELKLPEIAQAMLSGNVNAADAWIKGWEEFEERRAEAIASRVFGMDVKEPKNEEEAAYREWAEIRPTNK